MSKTIELNVKNVVWAVGALAALLAATVGATWHVRNDRIEQLNHELNTLKTSKEWRLPDTLQALNGISEKVRLQTEERERLERLVDENNSLGKRNAELQTDNSKLRDKVVELEAVVKRSIGETSEVNLASGESVDLIANEVSLGVHALYSTSVYTRFKNEMKMFQVGEREVFTYAGRRCFVKLDSVKTVNGQQKGRFVYGCSDQ